MPYKINYAIKEGCLSNLSIDAADEKERDRVVAHLKKMGFKIGEIEKIP